MAIELVNSPTAGIPVSTADYNAQNVLIQSLIYQYMANALHLTQWDTLVEPELARYVYIQHGGALFQVKDSNYSIGGAPANGRVYIKVERSGDELTAEFVNSAVGYSWNFVYNGFYHADGSQLLPYVLYLDSGDWYKYKIERYGDHFDIDSINVVFGDDVTINDLLTINNRIICYENNDDQILITQAGGTNIVFYLRYSISCYIKNGSSGVAALELYQDGNPRTIFSIAAGNNEWGIILAPGKYRFIIAGIGNAELGCSGVFGAMNINTDLYST